MSKRRKERAFYRLKYPIEDRPTIRIEDRTFDVSEISEKGARIVLIGIRDIAIGQSLGGLITFSDDETVEIEGSVLRFDDNELVVKLTKGISIKRMLLEQILLRKKYPTVYNQRKR